MDYTNNKYGFTGEEMTYKGEKYARIVALRDIHTADGKVIRKGEKGGWLYHYSKDENGRLVASIHSKMQLSFDTDSWVGGDAICGGEIRGNALLKDNAVLDHESFMNDNAIASGHAHILEESDLNGNCRVSDYARVQFSVIGGNAVIDGNAYVHANSYDCPLTIAFGDAHIGGLAEVSGWSDRYEVFNTPFTGTMLSGEMQIYAKNYLESDIKVKNVEEPLTMTSYEKRELFLAEEAVREALEKLDMPLKMKEEDKFLEDIPQLAFSNELRFDRADASREEFERFINAVKSYGLLKEEVKDIKDLRSEDKGTSLTNEHKK